MESLKLKQNVVSGLCKYLSVDPQAFLGDLDTDLRSLCTTILKSSSTGGSILNNGESMKWIAFAKNFGGDSEASLKALIDLNEELIKTSVLLGNGLTPSAADIVVFSAVHSTLIGLPKSDRDKLPHLMRWIDYIQVQYANNMCIKICAAQTVFLLTQNKEVVGQLFERISFEPMHFQPPVAINAKKTEVDADVKKTEKTTKEIKENSCSEANTKPPEKITDEKKVARENQAAADKKKLPQKEVDDKDKEITVSLLKIQIGLILNAKKHPSADSLLVEEIDVGEAKCRQVVSGLAKYYSPDQLTNRRVVLITNVKPSKLRDVASEGLVLCASNEDHTIVEPLIPPEGAKVGECVSFSGHEGKPEDVLNPKKKQLEKITPHLFTDDKGVATFKGIPFMTSAGPCTSSIGGASIK